MKGTAGKQPRCVALEGDVGKQVSCKIYPPCREFNILEGDGLPNPRCAALRAQLAEKVGSTLEAPGSFWQCAYIPYGKVSD